MRTAIASLLLAASLTAASPAAPAVSESAPRGPRCDGRAATVVGSPGVQTLAGTRGDDVIVSNGSPIVRASGGDDRICLTRGAARRSVNVIAGSGDDRVFVEFRQRRRVSASLGTGSDLYRGGRGADDVTGNGYGVTVDSNFGIDAEPDDIATGAGDDVVVTGGRDTLNDVVRLGTGDDLVGLRGDQMKPGFLLDGGSGTDRVRHEWQRSGSYPHRQELVVDNRAGTATADGVEFVRWRSLEYFSALNDQASYDDVTFRGSDRAETWFGSGRRSTYINLAGGDDTAHAGAGTDGGSRVDGGAGDDLVSTGASVPGAEVDVDVAAGTIRTGDLLLLTVLDARIAQVTSGQGTRLRVSATEGDDVLETTGCDVEVHGLGGDDRLVSVFRYDDYLCADDPTISLFGDAGDDVLRGSTAPELLVGGDGDDVADGGHNTDRCSAEVERDCEEAAPTERPVGARAAAVFADSGRRFRSWGNA